MFTQLLTNERLLKALDTLNFNTPTPVQAESIPHIISGSDILASAKTGSGKTAAFLLPMLQRFMDSPEPNLGCRALILVPTRELAQQTYQQFKQLASYSQVTACVICGGEDFKYQKALLRKNPEIIIATPGRLLEHLSKNSTDFNDLAFLVLDEADRMLDMGFIADINKIIARLPAQRQNLLFSATLSADVRALAKTAIHHAVEISVATESGEQPKIEQWLIAVDKDKKSALLSHLIQTQQWQQALIFIQTKHGAAKLVSQLEKRGIKAEAIHSGRSQTVRTELLTAFKAGELGFLVATGIAARGLDINQLARVINYDLPDEPDDYIHRIGRTGRAGATGEAISFVSRDDFRNLCNIESRLGQLIARREIEGFAPLKEVPVSILNYVPKNTRKKPGPKTEDKRVQGEKNPWSKSQRKRKGR